MQGTHRRPCAEDKSRFSFGYLFDEKG